MVDRGETVTVDLKYFDTVWFGELMFMSLGGVVIRLFLFFAGVLFAMPVAVSENTTFLCEYSLFSDQSGAHKEKEPLAFTILLDPDTKKAYLVGNNGSAEVIYRAAPERLTFIEETASGNLNVTVIARDGQSAHSRHPFIGDKILASQYYGSCSKK